MLFIGFLVVLIAIEHRDVHIKDSAHRGTDRFRVEWVAGWTDDGEVKERETGHCADDGAKVSEVAWIDQNDMVLILIELVVELLEFGDDHDVVLLGQLTEDLLVIFNDGDMMFPGQRNKLLISVIPFLEWADIKPSRHLWAMLQELEGEGGS